MSAGPASAGPASAGPASEQASPAAGVGRHEWERRATARTGAGAVFDPFPVLAEMRADAPVHATSISAVFGLADPLEHVFGDRAHVCTLDYATTAEVLGDTARFSNAGLKPMSEPNYGPVSFQGTDGPEHRRYRMLVQPAFGRRGLAMWNQWLAPRLDELIDGFAADGAANLYFAYCAQFPAYVTAKAFGVPDADVALFSQWAATLQTGAADPDEAAATSQRVVDYLLAIIADRRRTERDDLISLIVRSEITDEDGTHRPTDEQILGLVRNIMPAGVGTTYRTLGIVLLALLASPGLLARVAAERELLRPAIEEALRWNSPVTWMLRVATTDTELAGVPVPAGAVVEACIGAANRDPAQYTRPDEYDLDRAERPHLSFSIGPHFCIGAQVGRMEVETALGRLLDRLPGLGADPAAEEPEVTGLMFRMPTAVPARWD